MGKGEKERKKRKKALDIGMLEYLREYKHGWTRSSKAVRNPDLPFILFPYFPVKETLFVKHRPFQDVM